jgi:succinate dehydrogenase flavin-adding protein (antitoxin of CptAB toxin-antitoxin module)
MAAAAKGHDMIGTRTIFNCRGGCLEVDANNEQWIPEEYKALLVDELPDEFKEAE